MKKKTKKVLKSTITVFSLIVLAIFIFSVSALVWDFVSNNLIWFLAISSGILIVLMITGVTSVKKIKNKIIDIFT